MGCRAQPVRYPISRTVQQMTRETRMGQPSYTEFRILPPLFVFLFGRSIPRGHKHRCRLMGALSRFLPTDAQLCVGNLAGRGLRIAPGLLLLFRRGRLHKGVDSAST